MIALIGVADADQICKRREESKIIEGRAEEVDDETKK